MLSVRELSVHYGKVAAVHAIDLDVVEGGVTLVLGTNGAGKTSTLKAIAGLLRPSGGSVSADGVDLTGVPAHRIVQAGISLVPEGRRIFAPLTVFENLRVGAHTGASKDFSHDLATVFAMFPILEERKAGLAGLLSGGEQQMLAFGRALMSRPKYVLLDEPSMGLAPAVVEVVLGHVRKLAEAGIGVLMVEQNAEASIDIADTIVAVARGEVAYTGPASDAQANASVLRAFLGEAALASPHQA